MATTRTRSEKPNPGNWRQQVTDAYGLADFWRDESAALERELAILRRHVPEHVVIEAREQARKEQGRA